MAQTDVLTPADSIAEFQNSARDFLRSQAPLARLRRLRGTAPGFEREMWKSIAEAGWTGILVPEADGGLGLGLRVACAIAEEVGRNPLSEPYIAGAVQSVVALQATPASALKSELTASLIAGQALFGLAWQEQLGQLDPSVLETVATRSGATVQIRGCKRWVVPGNGADGWLVSAREPEGPALYWVRADTPGLRIENGARVDGTFMADLILDAEVPAANRLASGAAAREALEQALETAQFVQAAELLGITRQAFDLTFSYLNVRVQFGRPIGSNQALQHRMVDAYIQVQLASACLADALHAYESGSASLAALASRVKARCAHAATSVTRLAIQFHGAIGITDECDIGLYTKRAMYLCSWLGGVTAHRRRYFNLTPRPTGTEAATAEPGSFPRAADWAAMPEAEFRSMVRAFLKRNYPSHLRFPSRRLRWHEIRDWYMTLSRQGWLAPAWPKAYGGMELPPAKLLAFFEEFEQYGVARVPDQGLLMIGPILVRYGTAEQKERFLPKILSGEHIWCQGYSEPNAGSDLASLRTQAVAYGDEFVVTGQKIWTTLAHDATHIYLLVRTDPAAKKQEGISMLLVDMKSPGVTVRPIPNMAGDAEFCEVFFDGVRVPQANLVGELNRGWTIAKSLLGFERIFVGSPKTCQYALAQLDALATALKLYGDAAFAARFSELQLDVADLSAAYSYFADIVKRGEELPSSVSMLKIWATETYNRICALLVETAEEHGGDHPVAGAGGFAVNAVAPLMNAMVTTIYSGTNEIQRNIIAAQVLRFPRP
ncbi:MAG: acyl-CoA dehydrogenase family protein [Betaproteobacteria bacterium]|nr:acyl-CoA dehydrogenase family protein [Betaproteobacteria bacterium]